MKIVRENILVLFILSIGAFLRLYRIADYMTFLGDEGRDVLVVKRLIVNFDIPFIGPTASVGGFFLGPLYYYLMAPFLWLFRLSPVGPAVMVALFGIATIYLVYLSGRIFFNKNTAYMAASLYALSPLVISYSRSSWNPNLVPFFSLLLIFSLFQSVKTGKKIWFFLCGVSLGAGMQFHYLFLFLFPPLIIFVFLERKKLNLGKFIFLSLSGFMLFMFPFIAFELKNHFPNTKTIYQFLLSGKEISAASENWRVKLFNIIFRLFARLVFFYPAPEQLERFGKTRLFFWNLSIITSIISSFVLLIFQSVKKKQVQSVLLLLWWFFGVGLFYFYHKQIYDYYLGIMFALPFLLLGNLLSEIAQMRILKPLIFLGVVSLIILNWSGRPFIYEPNRQFKQTETVSRFVFGQAGGEPFNFALLTNSNSDHAYRYFFEIWGMPPVIIENEEKDPERKTVADQLLVICEMDDCKPLGHPLWEIAGFGRAEIVFESRVGYLKIFKLVHLKEELK